MSMPRWRGLLWRGFLCLYVGLFLLTGAVIGKGIIAKTGFLLGPAAPDVPIDEQVEGILKQSHSLLLQIKGPSGGVIGGAMHHTNALLAPLERTEKLLRRLATLELRWQKVHKPKSGQTTTRGVTRPKALGSEFRPVYKALLQAYKPLRSTHQRLTESKVMLRKLARHLQGLEASARLTWKAIRALRGNCAEEPFLQLLHSRSLGRKRITEGLRQMEAHFRRSLPPLLAIRPYKQLLPTLKAIEDAFAKRSASPSIGQKTYVGQAPAATMASIALSLVTKQGWRRKDVPDLGLLGLQLHSFFDHRFVSGFSFEATLFSDRNISRFKRCISDPKSPYLRWLQDEAARKARGRLFVAVDKELFAWDLLFGFRYRLGEMGIWKDVAGLVYVPSVNRLLLVDSNNLYSVSPIDGSYRRINDVIDDWHSCKGMVATENFLYIVSNNKLYRVNPGTGKYKRLGKKDRWYGRISMAATSQHIYIAKDRELYQLHPVDGVRKALRRRYQPKAMIRAIASWKEHLYWIVEGELIQYNPKTRKEVRISQTQAGWAQAQHMTARDGHLYIAKQRLIYRMNLQTKKVVPLSQRLPWNSLHQLTATP